MRIKGRASEVGDSITPNLCHSGYVMAPRTRAPQMRNVCFTWNNPPSSRPWDALPEFAKYIVWQLERGESGTLHLQGYCELTGPKAFNTCRGYFGNTSHLASRMGTALEASDYCKKVDSRIEGPWEFGTISAPGKRNDIHDYRDAIKSGDLKRDLVESQPLMLAKYPRFYNVVRATMDYPIRHNLTVTVLCGLAGTGKTAYVYAQEPRVYRIPLQNKGSLFFDGYDGHEAVLIDDFEGFWPLQHLLEVLDIYPLQVNVKYGTAWFEAQRIYITCNYRPLTWYKWEGRERKIMALRRRITTLKVNGVIVTGDDSLWETFVFPPSS